MKRFSSNRLTRWLPLAVLGLVACAPTPSGDAEAPVPLTVPSLIPLPVSVTWTGSSFELTADTAIQVVGDSEELLRTGRQLAAVLNPSTGLEVEVAAGDGSVGGGDIVLALKAADAELGTEGYELVVTETGVKLTAVEPAGIFRGMQTLRQLLPVAVERRTVQAGPWRIPTVTIRDYPRFAYRGSMLDVSRHFFPLETVERYIDEIAAYKINALHLHLSDDQGWRLEIKSWPNLTAHGAQTQVGGGEGGFYTQDQYRELVQYAAERYVMIVPEFDMPGHTNAALASYAELNCDGKARELYTGTEVGFSTFCTDKEITYKFIDDVVREVAALTPGPFIHIGGDESHSTPMKDYIPFVERVQKIVLAHGKQVLGWDEIANSRLVPDAVVHYWSEAENVKKALEQGAQVLLSPATKVYLDMQYDTTTPLGQHWAAYIEVDDAYNWDPETLVEGLAADRIVGIESPLWTETVKDLEDMEYLVFPRLPGIAEIGWSPATGRSWEEYRLRLGNHAGRLEAMDIHFYRSQRVPWAVPAQP